MEIHSVSFGYILRLEVLLGGELQQEMHLSPRTLIKRRDDGLDGLASMYSYLGQVKGGYGNT